MSYSLFSNHFIQSQSRVDNTSTSRKRFYRSRSRSRSSWDPSIIVVFKLNSDLGYFYSPLEESAEEDWKTKRELLLQKRVRSVEAKEALRLQKENNFVILDVRPEAEFKEAHPPGAINVQIYRLIKEWTAWDIARRAAFAFFGIFSGTEENPEFLQSVESQLDKDAKIIVACATGGTMKPSQNLPEGQQSRSLIAAYLLVLNGYKNVYHLEGGLYKWFKEELPEVSEE
ncbi:Rhodanese domain-containing protein [Citrus sinensis]|nr:Rhodanese domain-containing protein [Citrus sinensis]